MEELLQKALEAAQKGQRFAFATIIESTKKGTPRKAGAKMVVMEDGTSFGTIGGGRNEKAAQTECQKAIKTGKPTVVTYSFFGHEGQSICGGQTKVLIEPFSGKKHLIICGAGHIALPLSAMAKMLDFKVTVIDDRKEFANKRRFPHVDNVILGSHSTKLKGLKINNNTYIAIVTQGNEYDFKCLEVAITSEAAYIGVISSEAKRVKFFKRLRNQGISEKALGSIHAPMGLNVGAQTPAEIAVSILSEVIAKGTGSLDGSLRFSKTA